MLTYTTIEGRTLDLSDLTDHQRAAFDRAYMAFREGMNEAAFNNRFVVGRDNPLLADTGGRITREVWNHPCISRSTIWAHGSVSIRANSHLRAIGSVTP